MPEEQAVYLYGMGRGMNRGNVSGQLTTFTVAERFLAMSSASRALIRLRKNNKED